jgi:cytochrome P450
MNTWTSIPFYFSVIQKRRLHYVHSLHQRYGPIVRILPHEVAISDISAVRQIHKMGSGFVKGNMYQNFEIRGTMLCLVDAKDHARRRKYFANAFKVQNLREWDGVVVEKVQTAVSDIKSGAREADGVDILSIFTAMATEIISEICYGDLFRAEGKEPGIRDVQSRIRKQLGSGSHFKIPTPSMVSCKAEEESNLEKEYETGDGTKKETLLFRALADHKAGLLSADIIAIESKAFMVAGTDTTAVTLTYLIWSVLQHPIVKERLLSELNGLPVDSDAEIEVSKLEQLKYLDMVVKETLRLYGSGASGLPRVVPEGGRNLCGHFIPEGTVVSTQSWSVHRNQEVFEYPEK